MLLLLLCLVKPAKFKTHLKSYEGHVGTGIFSSLLVV